MDSRETGEVRRCRERLKRRHQQLEGEAELVASESGEGAQAGVGPGVGGDGILCGSVGAAAPGAQGTLEENVPGPPQQDEVGRSQRLQEELRRAAGGASCRVRTGSLSPQVHVCLRERELAAGPGLVLRGVQEKVTPDLWGRVHSLRGRQRQVWPEPYTASIAA